MIRLSRRTLLGLAMLAVATGALRPVAAKAAALPKARLAGLEATLRALLPKGIAIARIGHLYLASAKLDSQGLTRTLRLVQGFGAPDTMQADADRERIATRIRHDFERDRLVAVDGWILARTEARLCAICVLASAPEAGAGE
ncbi:MAG: hypothetical protein U1E97_11345 [Alphaproteobacteria bacterium]